MYYMIVKSHTVRPDSDIEYYAGCNEYGKDSEGIVWTDKLSEALVLEDYASINKVLVDAKERTHFKIEVFSRYC